ncbi:MAG: D-galactarate dehydratase [Pseudorhodobacter sp.]|nr:D-galactarate dehydratase [Pseudorhodobacter sp.]
MSHKTLCFSPSFALSLAFVLLAGCGALASLRGPAAAPAVPAVTSLPSPELAAPPPPVGARTAEALDTTTPAQRAAATAAPAPAGDQVLGKVVVALGNVTEPGFWLRSALVTVARPGQVVTAGGASVQVDLLPGAGAAQLSLAAFRALGLGLTDLPEVVVYAR